MLAGLVIELYADRLCLPDNVFCKYTASLGAGEPQDTICSGNKAIKRGIASSPWLNEPKNKAIEAFLRSKQDVLCRKVIRNQNLLFSVEGSDRHWETSVHANI